jgi:hypothetical protein
MAPPAGVRSRWPTVLSAIRGPALLKHFGHPRDATDRQWVCNLYQRLGVGGVKRG